MLTSFSLFHVTGECYTYTDDDKPQLASCHGTLVFFIDGYTPLYRSENKS